MTGSSAFPDSTRRQAVVVFALVLSGYALTVLLAGHWKADPVYFNFLAESFLHGRLHLPDPPGVHDLTEHNGRWYVPFPPLPALIMLPWIAAFGPQSVNGVVFSIPIAAGSAALIWALLSRLARLGVVSASVANRAWIIALFAFGTVHWYVACDGAVWFIAQVCTVFFASLAALLAVTRSSGWAAGVALALAILARPNVLLVWPLLYALWSLHAVTQPGATRRWIVASLAPALLALVALLFYNAARFENPLDFGYAKQNVETRLRVPLLEHGQFSIYHLPRNANLILLGFPELPRNALLPSFSEEGMGAIFTTPALLFLFAARRNDRLTRCAWLAVALLLAPLLLYYNTGWQQFGYRFLLDLIVPLVVLLAIAAGPRVDRSFRLLIVVSIAVNLSGTAWWFQREAEHSEPQALAAREERIEHSP